MNILIMGDKVFARNIFPFFQKNYGFYHNIPPIDQRCSSAPRKKGLIASRAPDLTFEGHSGSAINERPTPARSKSPRSSIAASRPILAAGPTSPANDSKKS